MVNRNLDGISWFYLTATPCVFFSDVENETKTLAKDIPLEIMSDSGHNVTNDLAKAPPFMA